MKIITFLELFSFRGINQENLVVGTTRSTSLSTTHNMYVIQNGPAGFKVQVLYLDVSSTFWYNVGFRARSSRAAV